MHGGEQPDVIIIATGSELAIAVEAAGRLNAKGRKIRVVSMPCTDIFDAQDPAYRNRVLPPACRNRIAIEAGVPDYWYKYVGLDGKVMGVSRFGLSAPAADIFKYLNITVDKLTELIEKFNQEPLN